MKPPVDIEVRREALDLKRSFLMQAPAGSGKTELLMQRFLALLAHVDEPEAVVAITFTKKAAGEMRTRVLRALEEASRNVPVRDEEHAHTTRRLALDVLRRDCERRWSLLRMPARLRIQTIDSLCASIAHAMPTTSGFGGLADVTDSPEVLYAAAAYATILLLSDGSERESSAVATLLAHVDNDVAKVEGLIAGMLAKRDQWMRHVGSGSDAGLREELDCTLARIVTRSLKRLRTAVPAEMVNEIVALARFGAEQPCNAERKMRSCAGMTALPGCDESAVNAWLGIADLLLTGDDTWRSPRGVNVRMGFAGGSRERERLQRLLERLEGCDVLLEALQDLRGLPPVRIDDQQWEILSALFCLLPRAVAELKVQFAEQQQVDFAEVAQAASRALGTREAPSDLALALGCRIEHLLVDEYQDTSVTQQDLLEKLTATWDARDGRTLFLVGDPMQSIYRFREAEVGLFLKAKSQRGIGTVVLESRSLTVNFRSQEPLVEWINATFEQVFPQKDDVGSSAVAYSKSSGRGERLPVPAIEVHAFIGKPAEWQAQEADCIADLIAAARTRDPKGKIAVLVRAKSHLASLVPTLRERGLRFRAVEIDSLGQRQAVLDLVSLTRALLHRGDRIAWLSVLRAPWGGLSMQDLYTLCGDDVHACVWDLICERASLLSADGQQRLANLQQVFAKALAERGRAALAQYVRGVWLSLGGPACVRANDVEDADTFFALLEELEVGGELADWASFQESVAELFAAPDTNADETLQLMSIHKAKGLEFDTVIVPQLGRYTAGQDAQLLVWMERAAPDGSSPELLLGPIKKRGADDDRLYKFIQNVERERGRQEDKRLLYVAATRAKQQLHLLGHATVKETKDGYELAAPNQRSLLSHIWPIVLPRFETEFVRWQSEQQETSTVELAAAADSVRAQRLRRLPATWKVPACPHPLPTEKATGVVGPQISFDWATDTVRHIGSVTHALLQKMAREGLARWDDSAIGAHRGAIRVSLAQAGVIASELERAAERVERALRQTLNDEKGRWVLDAHASAQNELPLTGIVDGEVRRFKLDRTFVDESGTRWIIDYKTGDREGGDREQFLENEVERYREQLETYARVLAQLDPRPVRLGLYFPLMSAWREWQMPPSNLG